MLIKNLLSLLLPLTLLAPCAAAAPDADFADSTSFISETSVPLSPAEARAFLTARDGDQRFAVIPAALIVMAGAKVWSVIVKNKPSASVATTYASAIPGFSFNWDDMQDWRKVTRTYRFAVDGPLQGRAVDIVYEVSFFHGSLPFPDKPGKKGHYLTNFTVKPLEINLKWGWKVSLDTAISDPMNIGTGAEPVAWLNADLKWRYTKPFNAKPKLGLTTMAVDGLGRLTAAGPGEIGMPPVPASDVTVEKRAVSWY